MKDGESLMLFNVSYGKYSNQTLKLILFRNYIISLVQIPGNQEQEKMVFLLNRQLIKAM